MKKLRKGRVLNRTAAVCLASTVLFSNSFVCVLADEKNEDQNQNISQEEIVEKSGEVEEAGQNKKVEEKKIEEKKVETPKTEVKDSEEDVAKEETTTENESEETEKTEQPEDDKEIEVAKETEKPEKETKKESEDKNFNFSTKIKNGFGEDYTWRQDDDHVWYSKPLHEDRDLVVSYSGSSSNIIENPRLVAVNAKGETIDEEEISPSYENSEETSNGYYNYFSFKVDASKEGVRYYVMDFEMKGETCHSEKCTTKVDNHAPTVSIQFNSDNSEYAPYYGSEVEVVAQIKEWNLADGNMKVTGPEGLEAENSEFTLSDENKLEESQNVYEIKAKYNADGEYVVSGEFTDKAGNKATIADGQNFIIDTVAPKVSVSFDNNNVKNEKYYNADRVAKINIIDENIDSECVGTDKFTCDGIENASVGQLSGEGKEYSFDITFSKDGTYCFKDFNFVDKAGHKCEIEDAEGAYKEFVIDKTAPVIEVNYDNDSCENEKYYKAARTATIDFKEANFDGKLVKWSKIDGAENNIPNQSDYVATTDNNQTKIKFEADGTYGFKVTCEDLAGNISEEYSSKEFVIDTTEPELDITGVEDMSSNNGAVAPMITAKDLNLRDSLLDISFTGAKHGAFSPAMEKSIGKNEVSFKILDLPKDKKNDDFYTLKVHLKDLAGNEVDKTVSYSVNRFGSVYILSDDTRRMVDGYYVTQPQKVVITETNVDEIYNRQVSVTCEGNVNVLKEGRALQMSESNSAGNHTVTYTIDKSNFEKDGMYTVAVYSEDKASNQQSSTTKNAKVEFMVDTTAPTVLISDLEEGARYTEAEHEFTLNATDTIGISKLEVYADDTKLATYKGSELDETGGTVKVTIPEKDDTQAVVIVTTDYAGNETRLSYNVIVSMEAENIEFQSKVTPRTDDNPGHKEKDYSKLGMMVASGLVALSGVSLIGVFIMMNIKKKKYK